MINRHHSKENLARSTAKKTILCKAAYLMSVCRHQFFLFDCKLVTTLVSYPLSQALEAATSLNSFRISRFRDCFRLVGSLASWNPGLFSDFQLWGFQHIAYLRKELVNGTVRFWHGAVPLSLGVTAIVFGFWSFDANPTSLFLRYKYIYYCLKVKYSHAFCKNYLLQPIVCVKRKLNHS